MPRQILYRAGDYDINLALNYVDQTKSIGMMGQSVPLNADLDMVAEAEVELLMDSTVRCATRTNEFGAFMLDGIPEGIYDLRIKMKGEEIGIARFHAIAGSETACN